MGGCPFWFLRPFPLAVCARCRQPRLTVSGGLSLRPWRASDADAVRSAFDCPDIQRWHVLRLGDLDEAGAWIAAWPGYWANETGASWAITDDRDEPIGQTGLRNVSLFEANAAVSYWVLPAARGHGVAARALPPWPGGRSPRWACTGSLFSTPPAISHPVGSRGRPGSRSRAYSAAPCCTPTAGTTATCTRGWCWTARFRPGHSGR